MDIQSVITIMTSSLQDQVVVADTPLLQHRDSGSSAHLVSVLLTISNLPSLLCETCAVHYFILHGCIKVFVIQHRKTVPLMLAIPFMYLIV